MRTTISLDDELIEAARTRAMMRGESLSAYIARSLRNTLMQEDAAAPEPPPFRLVTVGGGGLKPGVDLDRASALLDQEDVERYQGRQG